LVAAVAVGAAPAAAQPLMETLTLVVPAAPGGGWDQTARVMQQVLQQEGLVRTVVVENVPGAGGTIGLAQFVRGRRGDGDALMVTGLVMLGAILTNASPVTLDKTTAMARLTGEYEVLTVPADSPIHSAADLVTALRASPRAVSWGGGSAGGTDHILAAMIASAVGVDPHQVNYVAFSGGGEAAAAALGGQITVGVNGYGESEAHIEAQRLRAIAISSAARVPNVSIPTLREQQIDVELANWRAVVAPPGLGDADRKALENVIDRMVHTARWKAILEKRGWFDLYLPAAPFDAFVLTEQARIGGIIRRIGREGALSRGEVIASRMFPLIVLVGLASTALALAVELWRQRRIPRTIDPSQKMRAGPALLVLLGCAANLLLFERAGFVVAAAAVFWLTARACGSVKPVRDLLFGASFGLVLYLLFVRGLDLHLPAGILRGIL
jgi:putative tricarboxylic transport membrane protein